MKEIRDWIFRAGRDGVKGRGGKGPSMRVYDVLAEFLRYNRSETMSVNIYEYDEERTMRQMREEVHGDWSDLEIARELKEQ